MAAICQSLRFLKLSNPNAKCVPSCRAAGAGPPPWNSANLVVQACSTRNKLVTRLLKVRTVTFSSDSSRKWTSVWLVSENLDRSWQPASSCWWMLGSVSEHQSHSKATTPRFRFAHLVEIEESATGHAILPNPFSPLSWWDKTYMLQIVLIYHGMKLMNTLCLSHLICFWCLAMKASPMSTTFSLIFSLKEYSARKNRVEFVACCLNTDCSSWFPMHHHLVLSFTSK